MDLLQDEMLAVQREVELVDQMIGPVCRDFRWSFVCHACRCDIGSERAELRKHCLVHRLKVRAGVFSLANKHRGSADCDGGRPTEGNDAAQGKQHDFTGKMKKERIQESVRTEKRGIGLVAAGSGSVRE
jgi:hypothetical protein